MLCLDVRVLLLYFAFSEVGYNAFVHGALLFLPQSAMISQGGLKVVHFASVEFLGFIGG